MIARLGAGSPSSPPPTFCALATRAAGVPWPPLPPPLRPIRASSAPLPGVARAAPSLLAPLPLRCTAALPLSAAPVACSPAALRLAPAICSAARLLSSPTTVGCACAPPLLSPPLLRRASASANPPPRAAHSAAPPHSPLLAGLWRSPPPASPTGSASAGGSPLQHYCNPLLPNCSTRPTLPAQSVRTATARAASAGCCMRLPPRGNATKRARESQWRRRGRSQPGWGTARPAGGSRSEAARSVLLLVAPVRSSFAPPSPPGGVGSASSTYQTVWDDTPGSAGTTDCVG
eukprot:506840-Prorocentrum_minimum.AAC.4